MDIISTSFLLTGGVTANSLKLILPELIVFFVAVLVMIVDAFNKRQGSPWTTGGLSLIGLILVFVVCIDQWINPPVLNKGFGGMIVVDSLRLSFTLIFILVSALTVLISMIWVEREKLPAGEFHSLLLFATTGMMLMASGDDLVIIFLGLELLSMATYVMAGFRRTDLRSNESAMKYFILGSFSSAFLLYGIALIYGATATNEGLAGTTNISELASRLDTAFSGPLLLAGAAMLFIGFGFKIATAPFHVWTPDVYEGAPSPVTAFMTAGPKAAGFASFLRVFIFGFPFVTGIGVGSDLSTSAGKVHAAWIGAMVLVAVLTMTIGNLVAIVQSNVKRLLAYSSIAHVGYILLGFIAAGASDDIAKRDAAINSIIFYLLAYSIMNIGAFAIITLLAQSNDRRNMVEDYTGIGFRAPALSLTLSLFLLSLFGMPLTAGFMGKIFVFRAAYEAGYMGLLIIAVLNTALSAYYYLRLIIIMFFRERQTEWVAPRVPASIAIVLVLTAAGVVYLGLFPGRLANALQTMQESFNARAATVTPKR